MKTNLQTLRAQRQNALDSAREAAVFNQPAWYYINIARALKVNQQILAEHESARKKPTPPKKKAGKKTKLFQLTAENFFMEGEDAYAG